MKENKKVTIEQGSPDAFKRMILEEVFQEDPTGNTPKWDSMTSSVKEVAAEKITIFGTAFLSGIVPAFWICLGLLIAVGIWIAWGFWTVLFLFTILLISGGLYVNRKRKN